jgi:murein endopeptidase
MRQAIVSLAALALVAAPSPGHDVDRVDRPAAARPCATDAGAPAIAWRPSVALGTPDAGRLVRGVRLPARGCEFRTWDPILRRSPDRPWRRHATAGLVRTILAVAGDYRRAHPKAPPLLVGDLSRPRGGDFGPRFGGIGHVSHQNGLDADVYYPRRDRRARPARSPAAIDRRLAQDLVDRFVRAGARFVFVGPATGLTGPPAVVQPLGHHDDHLHVRFDAAALGAAR